MTPEGRQARRKAGLAGGNARIGRAGPQLPPPEGSVVHSPALLSAFPDLKDYPFAITEPLALKDALDAAVKKSKAAQAEVELEEARDRRDQARGKLMTKDQHRDAVGSIVGAIVESSSSLLTAAVSLHPPEQQPMARHQFEQALAAWRIEAMQRIKAG